MLAVINDVFDIVLNNILHVLAGCFLSYLIFLFFSKKTGIHNSSISRLFAILLFSFTGILIPVGTYGAIPIVIGLYITGIRFSLLLPLLVSNFIFNMSRPFTEMNFVWEANTLRILIAFLAGVIFGLLLLFLKFDGDKLARISSWENLTIKTKGVNSLVQMFGKSVESMGLFIISGAIISTLFNRYIFYNLLKLLYSSDVGSSAIDLFMGFDVTNSMFVAAGQIINRLMDFVALSAFLWLLKIRGVIGIYIFYALITVILIIPVFL